MTHNFIRIHQGDVESSAGTPHFRRVRFSRRESWTADRHRTDSVEVNGLYRASRGSGIIYLLLKPALELPIGNRVSMICRNSHARSTVNESGYTTLRWRFQFSRRSPQTRPPTRRATHPLTSSNRLRHMERLHDVALIDSVPGTERTPCDIFKMQELPE
jgi:hypothetical protein